MTIDGATGLAGLSEEVAVDSTIPSKTPFSSPFLPPPFGLFVSSEAAAQLIHDWLDSVAQGSSSGCSACVGALNTPLREFVVHTFLKVQHIGVSLPPAVSNKEAFTAHLRFGVCRALVDSIATQDHPS